MTPEKLVGKKFNIPIYSAKYQMYKCRTVETLEGQYHLTLDEIPESYAVPPVLQLKIYMGDKMATIHLSSFDFGKEQVVGKKLVTFEEISTESKLKELLKELVERV